MACMVLLLQATVREGSIVSSAQTLHSAVHSSVLFGLWADFDLWWLSCFLRKLSKAPSKVHAPLCVCAQLLHHMLIWGSLLLEC